MTISMYWTINSLPELAHLSARERRVLVQRAVPWSTRVRMVLRPVVLGLVAAALMPGIVLAPFGVAPRPTTAAAVSIPAWAATAVALYALQMRSIRRQIHAQLRAMMPGQRSPVCLHCGFDLRGAEPDACPECGRKTILDKLPIRAARASGRRINT